MAVLLDRTQLLLEEADLGVLIRTTVGASHLGDFHLTLSLWGPIGIPPHNYKNGCVKCSMLNDTAVLYVVC